MQNSENVLIRIKNIGKNLFFFLLVGVILIIPSAICSVYKACIHLILTLKHGKNFYRMMDGDETIWATNEKSSGQITTLFIHTYDEAANGDILAAFHKQIDESKELKQTCPKLFCRRGYFLGYYYFHLDYEQQLTKAMRSYRNVSDLRNLLCEYGSGNRSFGERDDQMMEVFVGTKQIDWIDSCESGYSQSDLNGNMKMYPVIVRTHHSLGDGVSLNCLFIKELMKYPKKFLMETYDDMIGTRKKILRERPECNVFGYLKMFWLLLSRELYAPPMLRQYDDHILHGKPLSGQKNMVWNRDPNSEFVQKVKNVKNSVVGASFNSVILAAISTTFNEYFQTKCPKYIPKVITSSLVTLPNTPKFYKMVQVDETGNITDIDMTNKYVICALKLPMNQNPYKILNALNKIDLVNKEVDKLKKSLDVQVLILCNRVIAKLLPVPCVKLLMRGFNTTFGISNLPGFDRGQLWHGGNVVDLYFWIPHSISIGIGISIFSSKGRLEMGLNVDKALIPKLSDTQQFLDRIMYHIDNMDRIVLAHDKDKSRI